MSLPIGKSLIFDGEKWQEIIPFWSGSSRSAARKSHWPRTLRYTFWDSTSEIIPKNQGDQTWGQFSVNIPYMDQISKGRCISPMDPMGFGLLVIAYWSLSFLFIGIRFRWRFDWKCVMLLISIPERGLIAMNIQIGFKKYMKYFFKNCYI